MRKVKTEINVYWSQIYCDPPCGEELKWIGDMLTSHPMQYTHKCDNGHSMRLTRTYPGREFQEL